MKYLRKPWPQASGENPDMLQTEIIHPKLRSEDADDPN
jgi:hypothetical protein